METTADYSAIYGTPRERRFKTMLMSAMFVLAALWFFYLNRFAYYETDVDLTGGFFKPMSVQLVKSNNSEIQSSDPTEQTFISNKRFDSSRPKNSLSENSFTENSSAKVEVLEPGQKHASASSSELQLDISKLLNMDLPLADFEPEDGLGLELGRELNSTKSESTVFDRRLERKLSKARKERTKRVSQTSVNLERYVDINGSENFRNGDTCFKNNQAMADVMGVKTMYFFRSCALRKDKIEFNYDPPPTKQK